MRKIKELIIKYKSLILYVVFGGFTTLINIFTYNGLYYLADCGNNFSNITAWVFSVLFAYITNKLFVFESKSFAKNVFFKELIAFFSARIATGVLDVVIMHVAVNVFDQSGGLFKILTNIIVMILNYIASKLVVFRKKEKEKC